MTPIAAIVATGILLFVGFVAIAGPALLISEGQRTKEEERRLREESA